MRRTSHVATIALVALSSTYLVSVETAFARGFGGFARGGGGFSAPPDGEFQPPEFQPPDRCRAAVICLTAIICVAAIVFHIALSTSSQRASSHFSSGGNASHVNASHVANGQSALAHNNGSSLAVKPLDVVPGQAESTDRCSFVEASMRSVPIVAMEPQRKIAASLIGVFVSEGVGPFS